MASIQKTNYFYIDEAGHLNNNSNVFILGCLKTDAPDELQARVDQLSMEIKDTLYYSETIDTILAQGFHATENHPDIRTELYKILPLLNFKAYFVLVNKKDDHFSRIYKEEGMNGFYNLVLKKLLQGRLTNTRAKNIFYFEDLEFPSGSLNLILDAFFEPFKKKMSIEYKVVGKGNQMVSLIDYLNYLLFTILNDPKKKQERLEQTFKLIAPKIALINYWNQDIYINRNEEIELKKIMDLLGGAASG